MIYHKYYKSIARNCGGPSLLAMTCSKLTIETLDQGVKYVQNLTIKKPFPLFWCLHC